MRLVGMFLILGLSAIGVLAQEQAMAPTVEGLVEFGFEADVEGWMAMDDSAILDIANDPAEVKVGVGALRWGFAPSEGKMPGVVAPTGPAPGGQSFSAWVKSSVACVLAVGLQETGGARYVTASYCPADEWKQMEVALADFMLSDDTTDDNDQLDPDQIAACIVIDLAAMFFQNEEAAMFLGMTADPRTILLDDFCISPKAVARQRLVKDVAGGGREITLQTFDTSSTFLIPIRNTTADSVIYEDGGGGAVALMYDLTGAQFPAAGAILPVQVGELAGLSRVRLVVSSEQPVTLAIMIEEKENEAEGRDKSGYTAMRELTGGGEWETIELTPDDFKLNDDSSDENGVLNGEQLSMLAVLDATAMVG
ncbi:MAG: hypothetical protein ACE5JM_08460, partial [Armatimonadota bacterium]